MAAVLQKLTAGLARPVKQPEKNVDGVSSRRVLSEGGPVRWRWGAPPPGTWTRSPESSPNLLAEGVL